MTSQPDLEESPLKPMQLAIQMQGAVVRIDIRCSSAYHAMEIYDTANATARQGTLHLPIITRLPTDG